MKQTQMMKNAASSSISKNKIKVKSVSQNLRKKPKQKSNLNNTFKESELIESIMRMSQPNHKQKSAHKLNQTIVFYHQNPQLKYSNRDYLNQSQNSRSCKKKGLNYMKQMMNKTVLIQNQDYQIFDKGKYAHKHDQVL